MYDEHARVRCSGEGRGGGGIYENRGEENNREEWSRKAEEEISAFSEA